MITMDTMLWLLSVLVVLLQINQCYQTCLRDEYEYCVSPERCARRNKVIFRDNCLSKCPNWVLFFENTTKTCYAECPNDTVVNGYSCETPQTCTVKHQVVFNRTCVQSCPDHLPYTNNGVCYKTCPPKSVINGTVCIDHVICTGSGSYIYNKTCLKSCPSETQFTKYGTCVRTCAPDTIRNGNSSCIYDKDCIKLNKVVYDGTCVNVCPLGAPFSVLGKCYSQCPEGYVLNEEIGNSQCISKKTCTHVTQYYKMIFNGTCVQACPTDAPWLVENDRTCGNQCPDDLVEHENHCISAWDCTHTERLHKVIFNGTCIQTCPTTARFSHEGYCMSKCPASSITDGTDCIKEYMCKDKGLLYKDKCVTSCPSEARFQKDKECFESCPGDTVRDGDRCIRPSECTDKHNVTFSGECRNECPREAPFQHHGKCLVACPSNPNYEFSVSYTSVSGPDSYSESESNFSVGINGTKCMDIVKCAENGHFVYNLTCISECPPGTATQPNLFSPRNHICSSLEQTKLRALICSACFLISMSVVIMLVYPRIGEEEVEEVQFKPKDDKDAPEGEGSDTVIQMNDEHGDQPSSNADEQQEGEEPVFILAENHSDAQIETSVDVHNDFPVFEDDIPLLPLDDSDAGNEFQNSDDDDAMLFGSGSERRLI